MTSKIATHIDFAAMTRIFQNAIREERRFLFEYEVYDLLLKIVSPYIVHKSDVGGVRVIPKQPDKIRATWRRMMVEVAERYADRIERRPDHAPMRYRGLSKDALVSAISQDIRGVLLVQFMPPDSDSFGKELIVGLRATREFGMVLTAGSGRHGHGASG